MILVCGSNMTWEDIEEDEEELLSEVDSEAREDYYGHMSRAQIIFLVVLCATLLVFGAVLLILAGGV